MEKGILLITENETIEEEVRSKILLLRNTDEFNVIGYKNMLETVKEQKPVLIIYDLTENTETFLNFLGKIKQNPEVKKTSVLMLFDNQDEEILCSAFEKGVTDIISKNSAATELTIRTLWCIQKSEKEADYENKKNLLSKLKIIDKKNSIYTENYTFTIFKEESKKNWGTFVVIAPDINIRSKISPDTLVGIIKKNIRSRDILGFSSDFKLYLWFSKIEKAEVLNILQKIQTSMSPDFTISAGFVETKDISFNKAEELANKALSKALLKGSSFMYGEEQQKKEVDLKLSVKNFKEHKLNFIKNLDNILSPLFFQAQKRNEEKLFETKIKQNVSEEKSFFKVQNESCESLFEISYPGYTKININISHKIKDEEEKKEKLHLETNELNSEKIEYLLNSFIKDFQAYSKN